MNVIEYGFILVCLLSSGPNLLGASDVPPLPGGYPTAKAGFQLRLDAVNSTTKTDAAPATFQQSMVVKTVRMAVSGELSDTTSYFIRLDVANALYTPSYVGPDNAIASLERAFFTQKWSDWLTMRVGRIPTAAGSEELDYSSMDQYVNSYLLEQYVLHIFPTMTGAELAAMTGPHTFTLQLIDGFQEETGPHKGVQTASDMTWTLCYRAKLWDGVVKPIVTYDHAGRVRAGQGASRDDATFYTAVGVGAQLSYARVDVDFEYDTLSRPEFTSHKWDASGVAIAIDNKEQKIHTMVGKVAYSFKQEPLRPFMKWSLDQEDVDGHDHFTASRGAVGVEYRPLSQVNFRYHAVITHKSDTTTQSDRTKSKTDGRQYIVGIAAKV